SSCSDGLFTSVQYWKWTSLSFLCCWISTPGWVFRTVSWWKYKTSLPLLKDAIATDKEISFKDLNVTVLVGSRSRREGIEGKGLLKSKLQGAVLENYAQKSAKVIVAGNPVNANCSTASKSAPLIPRRASVA
ncbi:hypothetical protein U0070_020326, partial [Myodes glareolus]